MNIFNVNILYLVRKDKRNKSGKCPIVCRINIGKKQSTISTGIRIKPTQWNAKKQEIKADLELNKLLQSLKAEMIQHINFLRKERRMTVANLKKLLHVKNIPTIEEIINIYWFKGVATRRIEQATAKGYKGSRKKLLEFFVSHKKICDVYEINQPLINEMFVWFNNNGLTHSRSRRRVYQYLNGAFEYAAMYEYIEKNPMANLRAPLERKKQSKIVKIQLTSDQVKDIEKILVCERLQKIKDCFLLQCYMGLSYGDLTEVNEDCIKEVQCNRLYVGQRAKNGSQYVVPLLAKAEKILQKYEWSLPVISNQKYNQYLKEIQKIASIKQKMTSHVARRTFGQIMLDSGYPIEAVSKMLGHSNIRITQKHYAEASLNLVVNSLIKNDISNVSFAM